MGFPYQLPALDLSAPFDRYRGVVAADWVDLNRHMNMAYYLVAFDKASDLLLEQMGLGWDYVQHELGMLFAPEVHVTYEREMHAGDPIRVTTQIIDANAKLMHFFHTMYHGGEGYSVATFESLLLHVDFHTRKSAPWPAAAEERFEALLHAHFSLPPPAKLGRRIQIRGRRAATPA